MAKKKMQARVRYYKKENGREGFEIEIFSEVNGMWLTDSWYPLVERKKHSTGKDDHLHWSILHRLAHIQDLGYDVNIMPVLSTTTEWSADLYD